MLAEEMVLYTWSDQSALNRDFWIANILRRESERLMLPHITEFLAGAYQPVDNDERLAMSGAGYFGHFNRVLAQLYMDAFAADPSLANSLPVAHRYNAACVAALAGAGKGADAANLSDAERAHWREQARQWLQAELARQIKMLESGSATDRNLAKDSLTRWCMDPDLAGIRDSKELSKLPEAERAKCQELWDAVSTAQHRRRRT